MTHEEAQQLAKEALKWLVIVDDSDRVDFHFYTEWKAAWQMVNRYRNAHLFPFTPILGYEKESTDGT